MSLELVKLCTVCKSSRAVEEFLSNYSQCRKCYNRGRREYKNTFNGFMGALLGNACTDAKRRFIRGREEAGAFNLTSEYLVALWISQNGKCYYSGIQMNPRPCTQWQCSIERIDDNKGYIAGNVIFICLEFNNGIKWSLNKVKEVISLIDQNDDSLVLLQIDNVLIERRQHSTNRKKIIINEMGQYICYKCNTFKFASEFNSQINKGCKDCQKLYNLSYRNTISGHLRKLLHNAKTHSKKRDKVQSRTADNTFAITFEDLVAVLRHQRGRCAYSNIRLNYGSTLGKKWVASLERIDSTKGYTRDNICIVCLEFNGIDYTTQIKYSNGGSGGWSKEKFGIIYSRYVEINQ